MPHVLKMKDGKLLTPFGIRDLLDAVEDYAGEELRREIEEYIDTNVEDIDGYKQCNSQQLVCDMQFTVVANESNRELRWQGASGWAHPVFFYYASSFSARSIRYPTPTWV